MADRRQFLRRIGGLAISMAALQLPVPAGRAHATVETCSPDASWSSLCNVEHDLRPSYLWIEQVEDLTYFRERISGMVRNRHVSVRWDRQIKDPDFFGGFKPQTREVFVAGHLRGGPDRVESSIIAHELWHAYGHHHGRNTRTLYGCLEDEKEAFAVGLLFYDRLLAVSRERPVAKPGVDSFFYGLRLEWQARGGTDAAMAAMADEHVKNRGYLFHCLIVSEPPASYAPPSCPLPDRV
jgi:hypothetical protein